MASIQAAEFNGEQLAHSVRIGAFFGDRQRLVLGDRIVKTLSAPIDELEALFAQERDKGAPGAFILAPFDRAQSARCIIPDTLNVISCRAAEPLSRFPSHPALKGRGYQLRATQSASDWMQSVRLAAAFIRGGAAGLKKVVLSREFLLTHEEPIQRASVLSGLARQFPSAYLFSVGNVVGATPELIGEAFQRKFYARALAGTLSRSEDRNEDQNIISAMISSPKLLHEHALLRDFLTERLATAVVNLTFNPVPTILSLSNVHHMMTEFSGHLCDEGPTLLATVAACHPSPAISGSPVSVAMNWIKEHEPHDRGWYGGLVGWINRGGDGQLALLIRSIEIDGVRARLVVGNGIVGQSEPEVELLETQAKLRGVFEAVGAL